MATFTIVEGIVSNLVAKALEAVGNAAIKNAASWWGARDELEVLEKTTRMIQARVRDAERRQEEESSEAIKEWLRRLKLVLYRVDDLCDGVLTLDYQKHHWMGKNMLGLVGNLYSRSNGKLANEIKSIKKELDDIKSDMACLNLASLPVEELPMVRSMERRETSSFVYTEDVVGRENEKNLMIEMLLDPKYDEKKITVIPIVGFGGLGKTTLAQLVFNDEKVQRHFDLTRWAYAPEKDNHTIIMRKIFKSFTGSNYDDQSLEQIQHGIKKSIETKKYLLVLDDIWEERAYQLRDLRNLLECGNQGSKVIITTRSDVVAKTFGNIEVFHKLGTLTDDQSWTLFKTLAFKPGQVDNTALSKIGKEIVKMCGNVPLAIKVIGGSLSCKGTEREWLQVRDVQHSKAQITDGNDIMSALKISYDYLPPALKQCFAYCSLFPKGSWFEKHYLVQLWMAQGYFEPSNKDIGDQYFLELLARNFFQNPVVSDEGDVERCEMHDLLHDLAQEVAGDESMLLDDSSPIQVSDGLVHVSLNGSICPPSLLFAKKLRSLLCISHEVNLEEYISRFQSLRVLSVDYIEDMKHLNSIGRLIHLRYLNIGRNRIKILPDSITRLGNLQTLNLELCLELRELPANFAKLANLRHLLIPYSLTDLSSEFGKMTSLQELNRFIVHKNNGIDSLPAFNLGGFLKIEFSKWRRNMITEVKRANLKDNHHLTSLALDLHFVEEEVIPSDDHMNTMLKCLQLPPNLKYLMIREYRGDKMPNRWLDGLSKLVSITISGGGKCKVLCDLSTLPYLKSLVLGHLDKLEYVEDDYVRDGAATHNLYFPSLEVLKLDCCSKLEGWRRPSKDDGRQHQLAIPRLLEMVVNKCPMLMSMPLAPKLETLDVTDINGKVFESNLRLGDEEAPSSKTLFTSLSKLVISSVNDRLAILSIGSNLCNLNILEIYDCNHLRSLRFESPNSIRELDIWGCRNLRSINEGLQHLSMLETLGIAHCKELEMEMEDGGEAEGRSSSGWQALSSLHQLQIRSIPKVRKLPRGITCLTMLQALSLDKMENLTELPEEIGNLPLLCQLKIEDCPKLKSLPTSIQGLPSLYSIEIISCPDLTKRYKELDGEDCHLIQHVPRVSIR